MHQLVDEAELARLGRTLGLPGEDDVQCRAHADEAGQAVAPPRAGDDAELHLGKSELGLRMIGGHAPVTGEREFQSRRQGSCREWPRRPASGSPPRGSSAPAPGDSALWPPPRCEAG